VVDAEAVPVADPARQPLVYSLVGPRLRSDPGRCRELQRARGRSRV
jgi:hypothetical protein